MLTWLICPKNPKGHCKSSLLLLCSIQTDLSSYQETTFISLLLQRFLQTQVHIHLLLPFLFYTNSSTLHRLTCIIIIFLAWQYSLSINIGVFHSFLQHKIPLNGCIRIYSLSTLLRDMQDFNLPHMQKVLQQIFWIPAISQEHDSATAITLL